MISDFAGIASFLWWTMLLASTAIILHDLASRAFANNSSDVNARPNRPARVANVDETHTMGDSIRRSLEMSFTGFQREVAETILSTALAARGSPLTKVPEAKRDMLDQLFSDTELKEFVQTHSIQSPKKVDRRNLKKELERTYMMLDKAERLLR